MIKRMFFVMMALVLLISMVYGQKTYVHSFGDGDLQKNWVVKLKQAEIIQYKGKTALRLKEAPGQGIAYLKNVQFVNGTIELDIAAIPQFTGIVFRMQDENSYEGIYFRPQNSKDPAKRNNTVQYISHPKYTWRYLREKFPGKYEAAADIAPDQWFHVKVVVKDREAKVFVNQSRTPCLVVNDLKYGISKGAVGVWCGNTSGGTFADFKVTPVETDKPLTKLAPKRKVVKIDPGIFKEYIGKYQAEGSPNFFVKISEQDGRFYTQATGQQVFEIFPESETTFFLKVVDAQIVFVREGGKVTKLIVHQAGARTPFKKVE